MNIITNGFVLYHLAKRFPQATKIEYRKGRQRGNLPYYYMMVKIMGPLAKSSYYLEHNPFERFLRNYFGIMCRVYVDSTAVLYKEEQDNSDDNWDGGFWEDYDHSDDWWESEVVDVRGRRFKWSD